MKFVHIADMHLDSPFVNLSNEDNMGEQRRLEQRKILRKIIEYIKINNIDMLFISGDLYEQNYIRKSSIEYLNKLFMEIPKVKIYITPGNHDPYLKNSYYNTYNWSENVKVFNSEIEKVEVEIEVKEKRELVNIWGFGFNDFYCYQSGIEEFNIPSEDINKINILVMHADLNASMLDKKIMYNPIKVNILKDKKFDYIALGHIHKKELNKNMNLNNNKVIIVYPGSTCSLGFDELGSHGMVVGEIRYNDMNEEKQVEYEFVELDDTKFKVVQININEIEYFEDLIEEINNIKIADNEFIKIELIGNRLFEININKIFSLITNSKILKIKDSTKLEIDKEEILKNSNSLKAIFLRKMLEKLEKENISDDEIRRIEKAIEIGLDSF